jgi:predicted transcriptional regulator
MTPVAIWRKFGKQTGIAHSEFDSYAGERFGLTVIEFGEVLRLARPFSLSDMRREKSNFHPPQLAIYLQGQDPLAKALKRRHSRSTPE